MRQKKLLKNDIQTFLQLYKFLKSFNFEKVIGTTGDNLYINI